MFAHGWWTNEGQKISKSLGNVIDPVELVKTYGLDPVRYFLLREVPFGNDGDFQKRALVGRLNGDLANAYGNLCQRVLSIVAKNCGEKVPAKGTLTEADTALLDRAKGLLAIVRAELDEQAFHRALIAIWEVIADANRYVDAQAPWALAKTDPVRRDTVLWVLAETIRRVTLLVQPFMPNSTAKILDQLGVPAEARAFAALRPASWCRARPAQAAGRVPALRRARRLPPDADRQPLPSRLSRAGRRRGRRAGARPDGGRRRHADHRHAARPVRQGAGDRRAPRQYLVLGRRPSARGEGGGADARPTA